MTLRILAGVTEKFPSTEMWEVVKIVGLGETVRNILDMSD